MSHKRRIVAITVLQLMLLCTILAQREASYPIVLVDQQVPREVMAAFESSRAIFSRYGQWLETRTKISSFPEEVSLGLKKSEFGEWRMNLEKLSRSNMINYSNS